MLLSTVIEPDVLDPKHFNDPIFQLNVEELLRGILSNGVIVVDKEERLYKKLCENALKLGVTNEGRRSYVFFDEILKKQRHKIIRFASCSGSFMEESSAEHIVAAIARQSGADFVIVATRERALALAGESKVMPVTSYIHSKIESKRRAFAEGDFDSCDMMSEDEFDTLIGNASRFSRKLLFYDKIIGKASSSVYFRRGIERILKAWLRHAYFPKSQLAAEIYTLADDSRYAKQPPAQAFACVRKDICERLSQRFKIPVSLSFKIDNTHMCHARHLQTESCTILFERGFDLVEKDGSLKRSFVNLVQRPDPHLMEFRQLPEFARFDP